MKKDDLLKHIAETAYNVGFGAKRHFATFDIVDKAPGLIGFLSMAFGVYSLAFDELSTKFLSATFIVLGMAALYISFYEPNKKDYVNAGVELTKLFNELNKLYKTVKNSDDEHFDTYVQELRNIETSFYSASISKQLLLSDWYAHYKFFWQHQIDWINEQKNFKFFRDKVPLSLTLSIAAIIILIAFLNIDFDSAVKYLRLE